jgi:small subunit ribosomal protein S1
MKPEPETEPEKEVKTKIEYKPAPSAEDFDWDSFESEEQRSSPKYKEYESLYDETLSTIAVDEVVIGTVIQMTSREVVVNIGYKSEGVVSLNEFRYYPNLKVGDKVEVYVESQEDKKGQLLLSHKKARAINSWDRVNASLEKEEIITVSIHLLIVHGVPLAKYLIVLLRYDFS